MHPGIATLHALADELRTLLGRFGARADGAWHGSWTRCRELFDDFQKDAPVPAALSPAERDALTDALGAVVRLNAVAAGVAAREGEALLESLEQVGGARRRAHRRNEDADGAAERGGRCDVRG